MAALWADKYRPKDIGGLDYNVNQLNMLKQMVSTDDFPHLLFVGPDGCGKRTRMRCLLKEIYGEGIFQMKHIEIPLETAGGKAIKIRAVDSKYHIEVRPSDLAFHDRMVVQKVIKDIAGTSVDPLIYKKPFRVVVMEEADLLTFDAQQALRRTMEKYASTCKLFLCCTSLNKIIEPLISRCMVVRLPAPTAEEAVQVLKTVGPEGGAQRLLARQCDRNLRRCLLTLEASVAKFGKNTFFESSKQIAVPDWRQHIRFLTDKLMTKPDADGAK
ncbi:Replication factor C subunit 3 [Aphelenchoides fujianensis]|nr:Replication factor C subunit 3 [Aphelenchoides fujianensis]